MAVNRPTRGKKYYTAAEANGALPLVRVIVRDITDLARDLQDRYDRLARLKPAGNIKVGEAYQEEIRQAQDEL
ncbi:MAG: DUF2203 family protein, partial [Planctomycetes bacterium]|nr:DUF2203 family protein [Planctomycetota bacterium]